MQPRSKLVSKKFCSFQFGNSAQTAALTLQLGFAPILARGIRIGWSSRCSFNDRLEEKGTAVGTETRAELVESNCTFVSDRVNRSMTKRVVSDRFRGYKVETDGSSINHRCNFFFLFFSFLFLFLFFSLTRPIDRSEHYSIQPSRIYAVRNFLSLPRSSIEISFTSNAASVTWNASYIRELFVKGACIEK